MSSRHIIYTPTTEFPDPNAGTQGPQGPQGYQGPQGSGSQGGGAQGPQGYQGFQGNQGFQGLTGSGSQGVQGNQGYQGATGSTGPQGNQGNQGVQGTQGTTGTQGPQGIQGNQGVTGSGTQGVQGTQGSQGSQGAPGSGATMTIGASVAGGATPGSVLFIGSGPSLQQNNSNFFWDDSNYRLGIGTSSPSSTLDLKGSVSFKRNSFSTSHTLDNSNCYVGCLTGTSSVPLTLPDASGKEGRFYFIKDEDGNAASNNITVSTTSSQTIDGSLSYTINKNYGSIWLISNGSNWLLAPSGPQGNQGDTGSTGPQGNQGDTGSTGPQGNQGTQGTQGTQGNQGNQGATGSAGPQGNQGNQGTTGSAGPQGNQGNQGATGSTGPQGNQGTTGSAGPQGNQGNQGTQGTQGNQGNQGTTGSAGPQGTQGNQGTQGFQGAAGSGTPAGSDKQIQYNASGAFAGNSSFLFDYSTSTLAVGGSSSLGVITATGSASGADKTAFAAYNSAGGAGASVSIDFYTTSSNSGIPLSKIQAIDDGSSSNHLLFFTKSPGSSSNALSQRGKLSSYGSWIFNNGALSTSATDGFVYVPTCAGIPTGTPTSQTGVPFVYDTSNNRMWFYNSGWKPVGPNQSYYQNSLSGTVTFNLGLSTVHQLTLGGVGPTTLALSNVQTGQSFLVVLTQGAQGNNTVTWFSGITWNAGTAPTLTATANKTDIFSFLCSGTNTYFGFIVGQAF